MDLSEREHDILQNLIVYLAFKVPSLSEAKLNKLIFLADFYHYTKHGKRITNVPFLHYNYGPWSSVVARAAMENDGNQIRLENVTTPKKGEILLIKANVDKTQVNLSKEYLDTLKEVIKDWGEKSLPEIVDYVKRTTLFTSTPFGAVIDFEAITPSKESREILSASEEKSLDSFIRRHKKLVNASLGALGIRE